MLSKSCIIKLISETPKKPGVYQYYNKEKQLLYVGKAKNLNTRVRSYFNKNNSPKTKVLVKQIFSVECIVVSTELDALLLENNLIKQYQPKYNVLLKDDKTYPWICITSEKFPRIFQTRKVEDKKNNYYGPYMSTWIVKILMDYISDMFYDNGWTPFSYVQRDLNNSSRMQYLSIINDVKKLLETDLKSLMRKLNNKMLYYSDRLDFERAQKIKEQIDLITKHQTKSTIVSPKLDNIDVFSLQNDGKYAYINYLKILSGAVVQTHTLEMKKKLDESDENILQLAIVELRSRFKSNAKNVYCSHKIKNIWKNIKLSTPKIGAKKKLLDVSIKNAKYILLKNKKRRLLNSENSNVSKVLTNLKHELKLNNLPNHIECFDISNTQGFFSIGACVVFKNGRPAKKEYRFFNIKTVSGPDDFKSIEEVVYRRYLRLINEKNPLPDLIIIDGGKGQLNAAIKSLKKLSLFRKIKIIGIAKRLEEIFFEEDPIPLYLDKRSSSLKLIQHLRDEAHRFSLSQHRKKREKKLLNISLQKTRGIGPKTIEKIILNFGSIKKAKLAGIKKVGEVVGEVKAKKIFN